MNYPKNKKASTVPIKFIDLMSELEILYPSTWITRLGPMWQWFKYFIGRTTIFALRNTYKSITLE